MAHFIWRKLSGGDRMAKIVDIEEIPGGYSLVIQLKDGRKIWLNFSRRHFRRLTPEELKRILREVEEDYTREPDERERMMVRKLKEAIRGDHHGGSSR